MSDTRPDTADCDARVCGTCGMTIEPPDEPIEPGDAWMQDVARARRCPECWQFPPRCRDCGHAHTANGCIGEPTPEDRWAGVSPAVCDCDTSVTAPADPAFEKALAEVREDYREALDRLSDDTPTTPGAVNE